MDSIRGLRARGHEVIEFSAHHKNNLPSEYSPYFVSDIGELSERHDLARSLKIFGRLFCSREVEKKLQALILATEPEAAHLHNVYHHLSASTFRMLVKNKIPIVMTVHDVQPMCPNHRMIRGRDNKLCEACFKHQFQNCIRYRCVNNSYKASVAGALEAYFYYLRGIWKMVDRFICPSQFMLDKMVEWGFDKEKMRLVRNPFVLPEKFSALGNKIVYIGRFHVEKGIRILMQALPVLRQNETIVAGSGPDDQWVDNFIKQYSLTNVERKSWVDKEKWQKVMSEAKVVVVPSLFYENCSMAILEALSYGRIVVAADRGGNRELVKNNDTGFLVKPEDPEALAEAIKSAMSLSATESGKLINNARNLVKKNHDPENYLKKIEDVYQELVK